jgi:hypothetical protein
MQAAHRREAADVARMTNRSPSASCYFSRDLVDDVLATPRRHDIGARISDPQRNRATDTCRTTDNDCDPPRQIKERRH